MKRLRIRFQTSGHRQAAWGRARQSIVVVLLMLLPTWQLSEAQAQTEKSKTETQKAAGAAKRAPSKADTRAAARQIERGLKKFKAGQIEEAGQAFQKAGATLPDDPRVAYNLACVAAAQGNEKEAVRLFNRASQSSDPTIVANSHYNLGCVAAAEAKSLFGSQPAEADEAKREEGLQLVKQAVRHYRHAIRTQRDHVPARRNLEVLRLWSQRMQQIWKEKDRQKKRASLSLLQFFEFLHEQQHGLRNETRQLAAQPPSPRRRYRASELAGRQRLIAGELPHLQTKLEQALTQTTQAGPAAGQDKAAREALQFWQQGIERSRQNMLAAADRLEAIEWDRSLSLQRRSLEELNQIYQSLVPFQSLLARGIKVQEALVKQSQSLVQDPAEPSASDAPAGGAELPVDFDDLAWQQKLITDWSGALRFKADVGKRRAAPEAKAPAGDPGAESAPAKPTDPKQAAEKALQDMFNKALELTPQIQDLSSAAGERLLPDQDAKAALPKQQEALRLLKEIAKRQPPEQKKKNKQDDQNKKKNDQKKQKNSSSPDRKQNQQGSDKNDNQSDTGKKNDSQDQRKKKKKEKKSADKKKSEDKKKRDAKNKKDRADKKGDEKKREKETKQSKRKDKPQGADNTAGEKKGSGKDSDKKKMSQRQLLSLRQAEGILRRIREREREHRERMKQLRRMSVKRLKIDKDW